MPDPLRRIRIPDDLESVTTVGDEVEAESAGMGADAVERIWNDAVSWYRSGVHPALQVCVRREGQVVLDRAIGHARGNGPKDSEEAEKELVTTETPSTIYSGAKAITAFVTHLCHERGWIDIGLPICEYIPGYERHGKDGITIAHVLAHRAGVPNLPSDALDLDRVHDRDFLVEVLCDAEPSAKPGSKLAYHAVSGGFILGEVIRGATGKDIRQVLAEEILDPLGFRWTNYGVAPEDTGRLALNYITGPPTLPPLSTFLTRALGKPLDDLVKATNDDRFTTAIIPAANLVTNANELSRFYEVMRCGGQLDGVRVMKPETIAHALTEQSHLEFDNSLGFPTRFSYGLMLGAARISLYGADTQHAFGHLGFTNILSWADPERAISVAVINNGKPIVYPELHRFLGLMQRITKESPKADPSTYAF